jgi:hypothetical protein
MNLKFKSFLFKLFFYFLKFVRWLEELGGLADGWKNCQTKFYFLPNF